MLDVKKSVAEALKGKPYKFLIGDKVMTADEVAEHVEKDTELGKTFVRMAVEGTIRRYARKGSHSGCEDRI